MEVADFLIDPLRSGIGRRALLEVTLLGAVCGPLAFWVVSERLGYAAESLAHGLLPGVVVASLAGLPLLLGAGAGVLLGAALIALAGREERVGAETATGVVVTGMLGLGALLALAPDTPAGLQGLLFGDILGVSDTDLALAAALALGIVVALRVLHARLLAVGFDRTSARALGIATGPVDVALGLLLAAALLVAVQGLGNLLVVAVLIAPACAARLVANRMAPMLAVSAGLAVLGGAAGLYLSYYAHTAAGASIAGALVATYVIIGVVRGA
jgi:ABC-type Mn2+/Zn2+ transport system permease subunit